MNMNHHDHDLVKNLGSCCEHLARALRKRRTGIEFVQTIGPDRMPDLSCPACVDHALTHNGCTGANGHTGCYDCLVISAQVLGWKDVTDRYAGGAA